MTKQAAHCRSMSDEELQASIIDLQKENFSLKNAIATSSSEVKPHQIQKNRRNVARALTILGERQRNK